MFLQYYGFREQPFGFTPDPRYLFGSQSCREAHASLLYAIANNVGFSALIAEPGMGKTTLLFDLLERLRETARTGFLFTTQDSSRDLLRYINLEFELPDCGGDPVRFHEQFKDFLLTEAHGNRPVILLVDEAQNLDDPSLEAIRLLSDFEMPGKKLLHVLLAGQPQFAEKLTQPGVSQFFQRVATVTRLVKLTPQETAGYIDHHIRTAGYRGAPLFTADALMRIAEASEGIPRQINRLCFNGLSIGCALGKRYVGVDIVAEVESDLDISTMRDSSTTDQNYVTQSQRPRSAPDVNGIDHVRNLRGHHPRIHSTPEARNEHRPEPMQFGEHVQASPVWNDWVGLERGAMPNAPHPMLRAGKTGANAPLTTTPRLLPRTSQSTAASTALKITIAALVIVEFVIAVLLVVRSAPASANTNSRSPHRTDREEGPNAQSSDAGPYQAKPQSHAFRPATGRDFKVVDLPFVSRTSSPRPPRHFVQPARTSPIRSLRRASTPIAAQKPNASPQNEAPPAIPLVSSQSLNTPQLAAFYPKAPALSPVPPGSGQPTGGTPITMVRPRFPENVAADDAEHIVVLDVTVDEAGNVGDVHVVSGAGEFVPAAVQAVRNWKYQPYAVDGQAVEMSTRVTLDFRRNKP